MAFKKKEQTARLLLSELRSALDSCTSPLVRVEALLGEAEASVALGAPDPSPGSHSPDIRRVLPELEARLRERSKRLASFRLQFGAASGSPAVRLQNQKTRNLQVRQNIEILQTQRRHSQCDVRSLRQEREALLSALATEAKAEHCRRLSERSHFEGLLCDTLCLKMESF